MAGSTILGIMVFFIAMGALLGMAVGNIAVNPAGTVSINPTTPYSVGTGNQQTNISTTGSNITQCNQKYYGIPQTILAPFEAFMPVSWVNNIQNSLLQCTTTTAGNGLTDTIGAFTVVGQAASGNTIKSNVSPVLDTSIGIAVTFLAIGLLAGLFGAGMLAGVISGVGIVLSFIYYILGVLNAPNPYSPSGAPYFSMPPIFEGLFLGVISALMIYLILSTITTSGMK